MARLVLLLIIAIVIYLLLRWLWNQPHKTKLQLIAVVTGVSLIALAITGRLGWIAVAVGALLPFARRLLGLITYIPMIKRAAAQFKSSPSATQSETGRISTVESRFLRMTLNHDTGEMAGEILEGRFKGKHLQDLSLDSLTEIVEEYQSADEESATLLQAYMEKVFGDEWAARAGADQTGDSQGAGTNPSGKMSVEEAWEILGLAPGANQEAIVDAHRRLMQKLHPDRGGSTYLAAKINQAKDILINAL